MPRRMAEAISAMSGASASAGHPVNHVCLAFSKADYDALRSRMEESGVKVGLTMTSSFGARGYAPEAVYFGDPDGNVLEARYYG
jgi:extradiol dioxygenase family protein